MTGTDVVTDLAEVRRVVEQVPDPELPILTLGQLGVIRDVTLDADGDRVVVAITPTYSGCPALEVIASDVASAVRSSGHEVDVRLVLTPAWTTDWISDEGRMALLEAGIAPPASTRAGPVPVSIGRRHPQGITSPHCPQCGAADVEELARFGSTACKALWRCRSCGEPFDYVKPL